MLATVRRIFRLRTRFRDWARQARLLGPLGATVYSWHAIRAEFFTLRHPYRLWTKNSKHPMWCRPQSSDQSVFDQVFLSLEYSGFEESAGVDFVVDCGANVGYTSAYFLTRFPNCLVVAIEPDEGNYRMLEMNLRPFGARAVLLRSGIWSHSTGLKMVDQPYRDGREWARQVREASAGETPDLEAVDISSLLARCKKSRISILKMDIEGAEAVVFSAGCERWLPQVDNMAIELHNDSQFGDATEVFSRAIAQQNFTVTSQGELTICKRG